MSHFLDRGAIVAGWIGAGMAMVVVIALALIFPVPALLVLALAPMGALIGAYANVRAKRRAPSWRVMANALWAAALTGLVTACLFLGVELMFMYLDGGNLPDGTRIECRTGPDCGYQRQILLGRGDELADLGINDSAGYEATKLGLMLPSGLILLGLALAGGALSGGVQALAGRSRPPTAEEETPA